MIHPEIRSVVSPFKVLNVNIFFIKTNNGYILVDSGIPGHEKRIRDAFSKLGINSRSVAHIILTHGHLDHIGCLEYARELTGAKVICHLSIADKLITGNYEEAVPRSLFWKIFNGPVSWLLRSRLKPVTPDILFDEEFSLDAFGVQGKIIHTPGHSPGSCSIILDNGEALIGDLVRENRSGKIDTGLFFDNRDQIIDSLKRVAGHNPVTIYLSHGGIVSGNRFYQSISNKVMKNYRG